MAILGISSPIEWLARQPAVLRGAIWAVVAAAFFTGMPVSVRYLGDYMHAVEMVFFRWFLGLVIMLPWLVVNGWRALRTTVPWLHFHRSAANFTGMVIWFWALTIMPLADAVAIHFTMPLFIMILAVLFLGERVGARRIGAALFGFLGVLVVLRPGVAEIGLPALGVLGSAMLYGVAMTLIKVLTRTETPGSITFYTHLIMMLLAAVPTAILWRTPGWEDIPALLILAACGTIAPFCLTRALRIMDASVAAPFDFLRLPFTALAGFLLFAEQATTWTWIGAAIIFGATTYITRREARLARAEGN